MSTGEKSPPFYDPEGEGPYDWYVSSTLNPDPARVLLRNDDSRSLTVGNVPEAVHELAQRAANASESEGITTNKGEMIVAAITRLANMSPVEIAELVRKYRGLTRADISGPFPSSAIEEQ